MIKLGYYNDGKGKWQSHEISIGYNDNNELYDPDFLIYGFGETKEIALEDFKERFLEKFAEIEELKEAIMNNTVEFIEINGDGVPIENGVAI